MATTVTKEQAVAVIEVVIAMGDTIRELKEVPSGELYARVMGHMSIHTYNSIIHTLKKAGVVKESGYLLTWVGPTK